jgi:hypothetical protein
VVRRAAARFMVRLLTTVKQPVAVAELGAAWIDGDSSRASAAPSLRLRRLQRRLSVWLGRGEAEMGGEAGGVLGLLRGALYL